MTTEQVIAAIRGVTDPELGISVVDLGLIYDVRLGDGRVDVDMTLTHLLQFADPVAQGMQI